MAGLLSCLAPEVETEAPVLPHFATYSLDECLLRSHNVNIFMEHIVNELSPTLSPFFNPPKSPCCIILCVLQALLREFAVLHRIQAVSAIADSPDFGIRSRAQDTCSKNERFAGNHES